MTDSSQLPARVSTAADVAEAGAGLPNFLIIGAAKSGTTSLAAYLAQHPQVFVPAKKEPNYFALKDRRLPPLGPAPPDVLMHLLYNLSALDRSSYLRLFEAAGARKARGEASVRYLYSKEAVGAIHAEIPDIRLVAVLREPGGRAYSHYNMNRQYQLEPLSLFEALEAEPDRIGAGWGWDWHYAAVSHYAPQLERYFRTFGREAVAVFLQDDLATRPQETFSAICRHIGVDDRFEPDLSQRAKVSYRPRNLWLDRMIHWPHPAKTILDQIGLGPPMLAALSQLKRRNLGPVPRLDAASRTALTRRFRSDVADLSDLLGRKLPWGEHE